MVERGRGKIIFTASLLSFQGGINVVAYTAAKSGIAGITQALANEWAAHGVNVNAVAPGYIETDNTAPLQGDPVRFKAISDRIPAGRWGNAGRHRRCGGVPRFVGRRLRARRHAAGRRRVARQMTEPILGRIARRARRRARRCRRRAAAGGGVASRRLAGSPR